MGKSQLDAAQCGKPGHGSNKGAQAALELPEACPTGSRQASDFQSSDNKRTTIDVTLSGPPLRLAVSIRDPHNS